MEKEDKRLYLIDGHALIYRAYFALLRNPLTTPEGIPTGAVYGFANYLIRLLESHDCPYWAVTLDSDTPTFRHEMYADYKVHREKMPDDLKVQIPIVDRLIEAFNIRSVRQEGLEADDLIATLAEQAVKQDFEVFIVSKDKDLLQLIGPRVKLLAPETGGTLVLMGPDEVKAKMGVSPEGIVDYLSLVGDASDNVPGVPGVGPKTALKILDAAGSVANLLDDPSIVQNGKLAEKIAANRDTLLLSRRLVTLDRNVPLPVTVEELRREPFHRDASIALFKELNFGSLIRHPLFATAKKLEFTPRVVTSVSELETLAGRIRDRGWVSLDTETTSTAPRSASLVGIALAIDEKESWYVPVGHSQGENLSLDEVLAVLGPLLESPEVGKVGQNLKYDYQIFLNAGVTLRGIEFDCMVAAYLIDPGRRQYGLDRLAAEWLDVECTPIEALIGSGKAQKSFAETDITEAASYAGEDVIVPVLLRKVLLPRLEERNLGDLFQNIEMPLVVVLARLEYTGVLIETGLLGGLSKKYTERLESITGEIHRLAGHEFNVNSPKQISVVLFDELKLPRSKKTKNGSFETNVGVLERLAHHHPIVRKILDHREIQKLLSTYIDALPAEVNAVTGKVHSSFNQTVTATGRLSSTEPNLQNIPVRTEEGRLIREAFISQEGKVLVAADYSQVELRILAHLSKDTFLIEAFREDRDIHLQTAAAIYGIFPDLVTPEMRRAAKTINFGLMYGMGPINLSRQLDISFSEAQSFIETYFHQFPNVKKYIEGSIARARELGYAETMLGRRRYLQDIDAQNRNLREAAERIAVNTPVQGTAADIIKIAMVDIDRNISTRWRGAAMIMQVHDELVFEVPEADAEGFSRWVAERMSAALKLDVPLKVDAGVGRHWSEAH